MYIERVKDGEKKERNFSSVVATDGLVKLEITFFTINVNVAGLNQRR